MIFPFSLGTTWSLLEQSLTFQLDGLGRIRLNFLSIKLAAYLFMLQQRAASSVTMGDSREGG
jgi:hypothetical protein